MDANLFLQFFREALNKVGSMYYGREFWTDAMLDARGVAQDHPHRKALEEYLSRYGERVFCYEFYHQIRTLMDGHVSENPQADNSQTAWLQAELKKEQIRDIKEHFAGVESLDKKYIPDFLLHSPGDFYHQEFVIEVKSNPNLSFSGIRDDLSKIQEFIGRYHYRCGIFLTVNTYPDRMVAILREPENCHWIQTHLPNKSEIIFMCKQRQDTNLFERRLNEIPDTNTT